MPLRWADGWSCHINDDWAGSFPWVHPVPKSQKWIRKLITRYPVISCRAWNWTRGVFFKDITSNSTYRGCKPDQSLKWRMKSPSLCQSGCSCGETMHGRIQPSRELGQEEFGKAVGWKNEECKYCWVTVSTDENSRMVSIVLICSSLIVQKQAQLHLVTSDLRCN